MTTTTKHHGSCLCGDVHFEVELDLATGSRCNCTLCTKLGATGSLVKPAAFTLLSPESKLASFTRTPEIGRRFFCARCHVYCFGQGHLEMLGGDFVSVNLNCVDGFDVSQVELIHWDGRHDNWSAGPRPAPWPVAAPPADPIGRDFRRDPPVAGPLTHDGRAVTGPLTGDGRAVTGL